MKKHNLLWLLVGIWFCLVSPLWAQNFVLVKLKGTVLVLPPGVKSWQVAHKWMALDLNSRLKTLSDSYADLLVNRKALVRIKENSEIRLITLAREIATKMAKKVGLRFTSGQGTAIRLLKGRAFFLVAPGYKELPFVVETPIGIAGVAGTKFVVDLPVPNKCLVAVWRGRVLFWNQAFPEKVETIHALEFSEIIGRKPPGRPRKMTPVLKKRYQEIRKLRLDTGLEKVFLREPGSKYQGIFSRGYSPTVQDTMVSPSMPSTSNMGTMSNTGTMSETSGMSGMSGSSATERMSSGGTMHKTSSSGTSMIKNKTGCR